MKNNFSYTELAAGDIKYRPDFGIDVQPSKVPVKQTLVNKKVVTSTPVFSNVPNNILGTFYDWFSMAKNTSGFRDALVYAPSFFIKYALTEMLTILHDNLADAHKAPNEKNSPHIVLGTRNAIAKKLSESAPRLKVTPVSGGWEVKIALFYSPNGYGALNEKYYLVDLTAADDTLTRKFGNNIQGNVLTIPKSQIKLSPESASLAPFLKNYVKELSIEFSGVDVTAYKIYKAQTTTFVTLFFPADEASYYLQEEQANITTADVYYFFYNFLRSGYTANGKKVPTYIHKLTKVKSRNTGYTPRPRYDKNNLCITASNQIIYIPAHGAIDNTSSYYDEFRQALENANDGSMGASSAKQLTDSSKRKILLVDWVSGKLVFTSKGTGLPIVVDMDRFYKMSATNYAALGAASVMDDSASTARKDTTEFDAFISQLNNLVDSSTLPVSAGTKNIVDAKIAILKSMCDTVSTEKADEYAPLARKLNRYLPMPNSLKELVEDGKGIAREMSIAEPLKFQMPVRFADINLASGNPYFAAAASHLVAIKKYIDDNFEKVIAESHFSVLETLSLYGTLVAWNEFAASYKAYQNIRIQDQDRRKVYIEQDKLEDGYVPETKNMSGLNAFQSHQAKVLNATRKIPQFAIIAVAAGGGKTIIAITDIVRALTADYDTIKLQDRQIKKCLVVCPNYLVKDYVSEINYVSEGKLNSIALDGAVFANYAKAVDNSTADTEKDDDDESSSETFNYTRLRNLVINAPVNTIFITGYDTLSSRAGNGTQVYGSDLETTNSHLNFLRSLEFDAVWMDESHFIKNRDAARSKAIEKLVSDIPYKRLMTGTIVPNIMVDLVRQVGLIHPSILGDEKTFMEYFGDKEAKGKVFTLRQGAELEIYNRLKEHTVFTNISRKEWAHKLPQAHENAVFTELSPNQYIVYQTLVEALASNMESKDKALLNKTGNDNGDDIDDEDLEALFKKYESSLDAIETFLSNPRSVGTDTVGYTDSQGNSRKVVLAGDDLISPKGKEAAKIIEKHLNNRDKFPGKIIIFANTHGSVAGIYDVLSNKFGKDVVMKYDAKSKVSILEKFNQDDKIRVLVAIPNSMEVGLNLQIADTLIRVDNVWTPGRYEQGMARIYRPNLKTIDPQTGLPYDPRKKTGVHFYNIYVRKTIDLLKAAKLFTKTIQVVKFYSAGTVDYDKYKHLGEDLKCPPLTVDNLLRGLDVEDLQESLDAYSEYRAIEKEIFAEYSKAHPEDVDVAAKNTGNMKGSAILKNVPFTNGMILANMKKMGLKLFNGYRDEYINDYGVNAWERHKKDLPLFSGFGVGTLNKENKGAKLNMLLDTGMKLSVDKELVYVITKESMRSEDIPKLLSSIRASADNEKLLDVVDIDITSYDVTRKQNKFDQSTERKQLEAEEKRQRDLRREAKRAKEEADKIMKAKQRAVRKAEIEAEKQKKAAQPKRPVGRPKKVVAPTKAPIATRDTAARNKLLREIKEIQDVLKSTKGKALKLALQAEATKLENKLKALAMKKDKPASVTKSLDIKKENAPKTKGFIKPASKESTGSINLYLSLTNDFLTLQASKLDPDVKTSKLGSSFVTLAPYIFVEVPTHQKLKLLIAKLNSLEESKKIVIKKKHITVLKEIYELFKQGKGKLGQAPVPKMSSVKKFLLDSLKPILDTKEVVPVPFILENKLFIGFNLKTHKKNAITALRRTPLVPGLKWQEQEATLTAFFNSKTKALQAINTIKTKLDVANEDEIKKQYNSIKFRKRKSAS